MVKDDMRIAEEMLREGKIISEENYNDGKKEICFRFVEFGVSRETFSGDSTTAVQRVLTP